MKNMTKKLLAITMLLSMVKLSALTSGQSFFLPRAQNGTAVDVLGWSPEINKYDADTFYFDFKVQSEWRQSYDSKKLGEYIFFNGTNSMVFGPQQTATTALSTNVFGLNFLLTPQFQSTVTANPKVQSSITDFSLYVGLDEWVSGLFVSAHLPLVYTRWNTHLSEVAGVANSATFAAGVLNAAAVTTVPYANAIAAWRGDKVAGDVANTWSYGKIQGSQNETKVGDIALNIGYNFVNRENMYFGVALRGLFGAGGHSKAVYVFEPMVGSGGRMGIGGMVDAQVRIWERDEDHQLVATFAGYAEHLFHNKQVRSYDILQCGVGSRYNMIKKLTTIGAPSTYTAAGGIDNAINQCTQTAKIGVGVVYEANLQLSYMMNNINLDLGYSVGGRSGEKFGSFTSTIPANTFILYSAAVADASTALTTTGVTKVTVAGNNTGAVAAAVTTANAATYTLSNTGTLGLNTASVLAPSVVTNEIYLNLGYTWRDNDWKPCVSLFGDVEFSNNKSLSTWAVGLQGNVSY